MLIFAKPSCSSAALIFLACIHVAIGLLSTERVWKTNCFRETQSGQCEESWIKISSSFYLCDLVVELEAPPKRIGYVDGNILAAIRAQTFVIHNETVKPMYVKTFIPPRDEFVDKKNNRYYAAEGTTYMAESETKKDIEIITTGEYSVNQLAFDTDSNQLLILSFSTQPETNERAGSLFAINTETIDLENESVQAEKVDAAGNRITAMAVEGDLGKLLFGMRTPQGGKLIRLTKQKGNPCSESAFDKAALVDIVKETQDKLLEYFESISTKPSNEKVLPRNRANESTRALQMENIQLKKDLLVVNTTLNAFKEKAFALSRKISKSATAGHGRSALGGIHGGAVSASSAFSGGFGAQGSMGYKSSSYGGTGGGFGSTQDSTGYVGSPYSGIGGSSYGGSPFGSPVGGFGNGAFGGTQDYAGSPFGGTREGQSFGYGTPQSTLGDINYGSSAQNGPLGGADYGGSTVKVTWECAGYGCSTFGSSQGGASYVGIPYGTIGKRAGYGSNSYNSIGSAGYGGSLYSNTGGGPGYGGSPFGSAGAFGSSASGGTQSGTGYASSGLGSTDGNEGNGGSTTGNLGLDNRVVGYSSVAVGNTRKGGGYKRTTERTTQDSPGFNSVSVGGNLATSVTETTPDPIQRPEITGQKMTLSNMESEAGAEKIFTECVSMDAFNKLKRTNQQLMSQLEILSLSLEGLFNDTILPVS